MVILCAGHVAPSVHSNFLPGWLLLNNSPRMYCNAFLDMKLKRRNRNQWITSLSKGSSLQDIVPSVKPSRLLPTEELKTYPNTVPEDIFSTIRLDDSDAFYVLELRTSRAFSSSLLDKNSAILICLIDVDGDSLLQRIPAIYLGQATPGIKAEQSMPFQSGSVDAVTFKGSKLQRIKEVWIGLESGQVHGD